MSLSNDQAPEAKAPMVVYQEYLDQKKLAYQFSSSVGKAVFYPRILCPYTGKDTLEWKISSGRGTIHSMTFVPDRERPFRCVVLVDLDEGFRMMSRIEGSAAEEVEIGMRVRVNIEKSDPDWERPYPTFMLEKD